MGLESPTEMVDLVTATQQVLADDGMPPGDLDDPHYLRQSIDAIRIQLDRHDSLISSTGAKLQNEPDPVERSTLNATLAELEDERFRMKDGLRDLNERRAKRLSRDLESQ